MFFSWTSHEAGSNDSGYMGVIRGVHPRDHRDYPLLFVYRNGAVFAGRLARHVPAHWVNALDAVYSFDSLVSRAHSNEAPQGMVQLQKQLGAEKMPMHVIKGELRVQRGRTEFWLCTSDSEVRIAGRRRAIEVLDRWSGPATVR